MPPSSFSLSSLIKKEIKENYIVPKKLKSEMYDKVNLMCRNYMDRMARFEVDYDFIIDEEKFKNVCDNFGYKEISEALELPLNTVKTKIRRAKAQLLKMMEYSDELL